MQTDSMRTLFSATQLAERVRSLGEEINRDYQGKTILVVGILKGSFMFLADLIRSIDIPCQIEFIGVSSYEGMHSTGMIRINYDLAIDIEGKDVLIVEDIIDTGTTIASLLKNFQARNPKSLKIACLLSKPEAHKMKIEIDYVGFEISKEFVIGYGLDLNGFYRNLPDLKQVLVKD